MQEKYVAPELQLAGEVNKVVLGSGGGGGDFFDEVQFPDPSGFLPDGDITE